MKKISIMMLLVASFLTMQSTAVFAQDVDSSSSTPAHTAKKHAKAHHAAKKAPVKAKQHKAKKAKKKPATDQ